jgi:hypothetical protein
VERASPVDECESGLPDPGTNFTRKRDEPSLFKGETKYLHFGMYDSCEFEMFLSEMFETY